MFSSKLTTDSDHVSHFNRTFQRQFCAERFVNYSPLALVKDNEVLLSAVANHKAVARTCSTSFDGHFTAPDNRKYGGFNVGVNVSSKDTVPLACKL